LNTIAKCVAPLTLALAAFGAHAAEVPMRDLGAQPTRRPDRIGSAAARSSTWTPQTRMAGRIASRFAVGA
jgi:hypothetical protein